jgi:uncharacterized protein YndB with AHSA1/START domain
VELPHPPETAFRYLVDPRNRPEWQASLLSITLRDREGEPHVGMTWRDNTFAGARPTMQLTRIEPFRVWEEAGQWQGIEAQLMMRFTATTGGCRVTATGSVSGSGAWALPAVLAGRLADRAIGHDLRRAGEILTRGRRPTP